jgi:hypothetical protein
MNWDEIVEVLDKKIFSQTQRHLKTVENIVLQGAWQGKTYEQMEKTCQYSLSYLKQAAGPKLWKLLSEIFQEDISKTNFRVVLERQWEKQQLSNSQLSSQFQSKLLPHNKAAQKAAQKLDWGEAPQVNPFYGRDRELKLLKQWMLADNCRLVTIFGMGGIGKTTLAISCARQIQARFDSLIWRSLHYAPAAVELVNDLLEFFNVVPDAEVSVAQTDRGKTVNLERKISALIEYLRRNKCLIVLDTATEIWQRGDLAGHYREQYKGYGELLQRLGEESHQSCLLLCTGEKPREVALLEGAKTSVRSLHLQGLAAEAHNILQEKQLLDIEKWSELIQLYRGNPLALKIVATTIQELFGGSVSAFLKQDTLVYGDIYDLLDEQFERLSNAEQEIINWLAIAYQPISLVRLQSDILLPINTAELIEALESLVRRSLISRTTVKGEILFSLHQPVVAQYAISQAIEKVCAEIETVSESQDFSQIEFLRNYTLVTSEKETHKLQLERLIIPIKNRLYRLFRDESYLETKLQTILSLLENKTPLAVGYTRQNLEILLQVLQADLAKQTSILS